MDVITTAVTAGASEGGISAAYEMLKSRLAGQSASVADAIADVEQDPGSLSRQFALSDSLAAAGLAGDRYLRAAARNLIDEVERRQTARRRPQPDAGERPNHAILSILFATDRELSGDHHPARLFGAVRGPLRYGHCEVSVPRSPHPAHGEPASVVREEWRADGAQQAVLLEVHMGDRDACLTAVAGNAPDRASDVLLFLPGARTTFEDGARRIARLAYDLAFDGPALLYSWPSQGRRSGYIVDEANVEWSQANLALFLADLLQDAQAARLFLVAQGMGCRALARAAAGVVRARPELAARLAAVVLVAPDIDAAVFDDELAPALTGAGVPVTVYLSGIDAELTAAKRVHGYARAGETETAMRPAKGVDTIDAADADTAFIEPAHGAGRPSVLHDLGTLIRRGARAAERPGLRAVDGTSGRSWLLRHGGDN